MRVYLSPLAEAKLIKLTKYLLLHWNLKVKKEFIAKLTGKIHQISAHPESCPQSSAFKGLFKCVVTKQTTFYYRIHPHKEEIEIITFFDTRKHPNKLKKQLK